MRIKDGGLEEAGVTKWWLEVNIIYNSASNLKNNFREISLVGLSREYKSSKREL